MASPTPVLLNTIVKAFGAFTKRGQIELKGLELFGLTGTADVPDPHTSATYMLQTAGVDAIVLAAPISGLDDGKVIDFISATAQAHTITATGLLNTGSANVNVATFAAQKGAGVSFMAFGGKWFVLSSVGITFS